MKEWKIGYDNWQPGQQPLREALCTLGNGYFATRGAAEEAKADEKVHYPGTYLAGGYNRLTSQIAGREIENEDLVNWPNWLPLSFRHPGEDWFRVEQVELISFRQELLMQKALLLRKLHFRDGQGRETRLVSRRLVHMGDPHTAALEWELTPLNWSGEIEVRSALDGQVINNGVARYRALESRHLEPLKAGAQNEETIFLLVQTTQSNLRMALAARTRLFPAKENYLVSRSSHTQEPGYAEQRLLVRCHQQRPLFIEKTVSLFTSRDLAISEPLLEALTHISRAGNFSQLLESHQAVWRHIWNRCDLELACNNEVQPILRLHIFHLLQTVSGHIAELDVGVPARGLHGEAYRGHIFWDELFIFPFLNLRLPEITRELLLYRYRRLPEARIMAREAGYRGAMFPWQSGSNGREESQVVHLNPESGNWLPDNTHLQRHISAGIAYNVWQYYQATQDMEFMTFYGARLIFDIAQFWSTIAQLNPETGRYEIHQVVGPDEYHTAYPGSDRPGLNNNAYTNVMAAWVMQCALQLFDIIDDSRLRELFEKLHIEKEDLVRWRTISQRMYVPFIQGTNLISQFDGYEKLEELDWDYYKNKHGEAMRLDRILEREGDDVNKYKASKQADVLMLFYLFSAEELVLLFQRLGYEFKPDSIPDNIAFYESRTSHGSTLSKIVHSWVLARSDRRRSWNNFTVALKSDVEDLQGGTAQEGIHLGAMAGTVDLVQRGYHGLEIREDVLWLNPVLPEEINCAKMQLRYRSHWLSLEITHQKMKITVDNGWANEVQIGVRGEVLTFKTGDQQEFDISR
jgi:trehalose/maltose hydrolase-like predicted phosphorylase